MISEIRSAEEEFLNSLIHGFGVILSIIAFITLTIYTSYKCSFIEIVSSIIYGTSLVLLYMASTFYHRAKSQNLKNRLELVDHACIYLLIAGTYTPITLITLKGDTGLKILYTIWFMAFIGVIFKLFFYNKKGFVA
ncbi:MAG: hemolysin III family protein [Candidatus Sericytochromatia bacterium]